MNWKCKHTWPKAMKNTAWCLMGCSIGDFGTILFFQINNIDFPLLGIMVLAIINGLITSIILETIVLTKELGIKRAFNTAIGMSLISMISMEASMNIVDYIATGGAILNLLGSSHNVDIWFYNSSSLQLLETKKIWYFVSLKNNHQN